MGIGLLKAMLRLAPAYSEVVADTFSMFWYSINSTILPDQIKKEVYFTGIVRESGGKRNITINEGGVKRNYTVQDFEVEWKYYLTVNPAGTKKGKCYITEYNHPSLTYNGFSIKWLTFSSGKLDPKNVDFKALKCKP
ncbi:MAG: hypothetical protein QXR62_03510 [Candidatus Bathyarchaeia archaeon]